MWRQKATSVYVIIGSLTCLQCLLAVTETETRREREREREREGAHTERLENDVVSSVLKSAYFTRRL